MISVIPATKSIWYCLLLLMVSGAVWAQEIDSVTPADTSSNTTPKPLRLKAAPDTGSVVVTSILPMDTISLIPKDTIKNTASTKQKKTDLEDEVNYHARDSIRFSVEEKKVYLYGDAQINYQDIELKADYIIIDQVTKEVYAEGTIDSTGKMIGKPQFKSGDQNFTAKRMRYNFDTEKGKILDVITQEGEGNIRGETVKKAADDSYYIKDGGYTTCDAEEPHYMIAAKKLKVIPNDKVVSGPAFLMFEGVYTPLVIPFGWFPNKSGRKSGIIFPEYGESPSQGFFFRNFGYYFNLGDKIDLAATGDVYTGGSYGVRLNSNYRKRYKFNGSIELSHNSLRNSDPEFPDYTVQNNFFFKWRHQQDPKARPSTTFSADVNAGTNTNFSNSLTTNTQDFLTNTFRSSIAFTKRWPGKPFNLSLNMSHNQNTQTRQVTVTLPQIAFNVQRFYPFKRKIQVGKQRWYEKIGLTYSLNTENRLTTIDTSFFTRSSLGKLKNGVRQTVQANTSFKAFKYFTVSPSVSYNERWFFQRLDKGWDNELQEEWADTTYGFYSNRDVNASINMNTTLYGLVQFKKGAIRGIRHVFNPRVGFSYRPKLTDNEVGYFGPNGTLSSYHHDDLSLYGKAPTFNNGSFNFGFGNTLEMKVRSKKDTITGYKKVKILEALNVSSSYNLFADSLNLSDININGRTTLLERLNVNFTMNFTPYAQDTLGRKINKWLIDDTGELTRLTNATLNLTFNLNGQSKSKDYQSDKGTSEELAQINAQRRGYIDFNVPWNLFVGYNLAATNVQSEYELSQFISFSGDVSITPKWKIGFSSGYDFQRNDLTQTSVSIYRDLHCWEFSMSWVPFGTLQSWSFDLKVKSSILQDLKLSRRKDWYDY